MQELTFATMSSSRRKSQEVNRSMDNLIRSVENWSSRFTDRRRSNIVVLHKNRQKRELTAIGGSQPLNSTVDHRGLEFDGTYLYTYCRDGTDAGWIVRWEAEGGTRARYLNIGTGNAGIPFGAWTWDQANGRIYAVDEQTAHGWGNRGGLLMIGACTPIYLYTLCSSTGKHLALKPPLIKDNQIAGRLTVNWGQICIWYPPLTCNSQGVYTIPRYPTPLDMTWNADKETLWILYQPTSAPGAHSNSLTGHYGDKNTFWFGNTRWYGDAFNCPGRGEGTPYNTASERIGYLVPETGTIIPLLEPGELLEQQDPLACDGLSANWHPLQEYNTLQNLRGLFWHNRFLYCRRRNWTEHWAPRPVMYSITYDEPELVALTVSEPAPGASQGYITGIIDAMEIDLTDPQDFMVSARDIGETAYMMKSTGDSNVYAWARTEHQWVSLDGNVHPISIDDGGGSLTIDSGAGSLGIDDDGGSLSIDDKGLTLSIDDFGGSLTVDGIVTTSLRKADAINYGQVPTVNNVIAVQVLASNSSRKGVAVMNREPIYGKSLYIGNDILVTTANGMRLEPQQMRWFNNYTGSIWGICDGIGVLSVGYNELVKT